MTNRTNAPAWAIQNKRAARDAAKDLPDDELREYWAEYNRRAAWDHGQRVADRQAANG